MDVHLEVGLALGALISIAELPGFRRRRVGARMVDEGSYAVLFVLFALGNLLAFGACAIQRQSPRLQALGLGGWSLWVGGALTIVGTAFRSWSMRTLGRWFTQTVQVAPDQPLVQHGPYRLLRHPSYAGGALATLGVGLALGNLASLAFLALSTVIGCAHRIRIEERALIGALGDRYREYMRTTWRVIPYVL